MASGDLHAGFELAVGICHSLHSLILPLLECFLRLMSTVRVNCVQDVSFITSLCSVVLLVGSCHSEHPESALHYARVS